MSEDGPFGDNSWTDISIAIAAVVVTVAAVVAIAWFLFANPLETTAMDRACMDEFGDDWHASGYSSVAYPPTIHCAGPDDQLGLLPMPEDIREEENIVLANETRGT